MDDKIIIDREKLSFGKYTKRYADLSSDQMAGLLWLLGEWSARHDNHHPRSQAAKKALMEFSRAPLTLEEVKALMRSVRMAQLMANSKARLDRDPSDS